jgi:hypothetical protein
MYCNLHIARVYAFFSNIFFIACVVSFISLFILLARSRLNCDVMHSVYITVILQLSGKKSDLKLASFCFNITDFTVLCLDFGLTQTNRTTEETKTFVG